MHIGSRSVKNESSRVKSNLPGRRVIASESTFINSYSCAETIFRIARQDIYGRAEIINAIFRKRDWDY